VLVLTSQIQVTEATDANLKLTRIDPDDEWGWKVVKLEAGGLALAFQVI
jgi:hypothetical protein